MLTKAAKTHLMIPLHFDLYATNGVNPAYFVDTLAKPAPGLSFHIFARANTICMQNQINQTKNGGCKKMQNA